MTESFAFNEENCPHTFGELVWEWRRRYWRRHGRLSQEKLGDQIVLENGRTVGKNLISLWENGTVLPIVDDAGMVIDAIVKALLCSAEEKDMLSRAYICDLAKQSKIRRM